MTRLGVKQVLKLDYTIEDPQERNKLVEQIIAETPDINERYLEILGDYLMNGIEKQDRKDKRIKALSENHAVTISKHETSLEGLVASLENGEDGIYNMIANYKNIKQACELWNQGCDIEEICNKLNKSLQTVQQKLRLGNKYGMCIYDKHINLSNAQKLKIKNTTKYCKSVKCTTTGKIFNSIKEALEFYNIKNKTGISDCLSGK